jgi:hypothetical protein
MGAASYKVKRRLMLKVAVTVWAILLAIAIGWELARAADIKLAWDANTESDLAGYNLYYGTTARTGTDPKACTMCGYSTKVPLGKLTPTDVFPYTQTGLIKGTVYFLSLTARDDSGNESGFSNEVSGTAKDYVPPTDPKNMKIVP